MKKLLLLAGSAVSSAAVFAEGGTGSIPTTEIITNLGNLQTSLTDFVSAVLPVVVTIGGAFMAFWLGRMVFGLIKSWANAGK